MGGQFRFDMDGRDKDTVEFALAHARVIHGKKPEFRTRSWKGPALLELARYYMANTDESVTACIVEQDKAVLEAREEAAGSSKKFTPKHESRIRQRIRDQWLEEQKQGHGKAVVMDNERLYESILVAGSRYLVECHRNKQERENFSVFESDAFERAKQRWNNKGGFLLRIRGDSRSLTKGDSRPVFYLWMESEIELAIENEYISLMNDIHSPQIEISEIVPPGEVDWDPPEIATSRLKLKE